MGCISCFRQEGENDIYYQPLTGGTEVHLSDSGDQRDPTIQVISSALSRAAKTATTSLFTIFVAQDRFATDTPADNEKLSEIDVATAWAELFTSSSALLTSTPLPFRFGVTEDQITDLMALVRSFQPSARNYKQSHHQTTDCALPRRVVCNGVLFTHRLSTNVRQSGKKLTRANVN